MLHVVNSVAVLLLSCCVAGTMDAWLTKKTVETPADKILGPRVFIESVKACATEKHGLRANRWPRHSPSQRLHPSYEAFDNACGWAGTLYAKLHPLCSHMHAHCGMASKQQASGRVATPPAQPAMRTSGQSTSHHPKWQCNHCPLYQAICSVCNVKL